MLSGVDVEISKNQKDELTLTGNSLENVSQSAADIQQICRVRNKDIRKVRICGKGIGLERSLIGNIVLGRSLRFGTREYRGGGCCLKES